MDDIDLPENEGYAKMSRNRCVLLLVTFAAVAVAPACVGAAEMSADAAWKAMPKYEPG